MDNALTNGVCDAFFPAALVVIALFYAIYFAKQLAQKKRGIQTRQLGKRKEKQIRTVETLLSFTTLVIVPVQLLSVFFGWNASPNALRLAGCVIGLSGDLVFLVAVITMKDSWRAGIPDEDKTELISNGIYRYSRNPAFLGFDLMYLGILLMYLNLALLAMTLLTAVALHLQILQEEKYLCATFGDAYLAYKARTARYLGRRG